RFSSSAPGSSPSPSRSEPAPCGPHARSAPAAAPPWAACRRRRSGCESGLRAWDGTRTRKGGQNSCDLRAKGNGGMRILVANDDGVYSPGLAALAAVAAEFGETRIVAPDVEMSSAGHSITATRPLSYKRTPIRGVEAWRVNGTPADCVALGISQWDKVD